MTLWMGEYPALISNRFFVKHVMSTSASHSEEFSGLWVAIALYNISLNT